MVRLSVSVLALMASTSLAAAVPATLATNAEIRSNTFSFSSWVEEIIANPDGDHLSVDEAVEAFYAADNAGSLDKRAKCRGDDSSVKPATVKGAVSCIKALAKKGSKKCTIKGSGTYCHRTKATIHGVTGGTGISTTQSDTCNNIARSAGKVMDKCTRADKTVNGYEYGWKNKHIAVHINR